ncbi:solute carrier family 22 member 3 isoform X2 [Centrocercus urophasianus]|uniref:solute carrier family 22 member 3 isoform X2 n=1 Tax=Centrocercus urophasianus TaxID=9002 RepID=UPI001C650BD1|nr:solute carrier family 22 member 3 isoform X2 [Centrocercus urophasianus]
MPSFDEVLKEAGEFGRFQKRVFFLLCQTGITFSFLFASVVFLGQVPDNYWCRIPGAADLSEKCGWTLEEERNFTVLPLLLVNGSSGGRCERLDVTWDAAAGCASPLSHRLDGRVGSPPLATCQDSWVYQQPHASIVSEYNLVCGHAWMLDLSQAILNLGFLAGAFTLGYAADRVVPESPRWLLTRKKGEKALKIMHDIAKHNGKYLSPHYSEITVSNVEVTNPSFLDLVRTPQMRRNTLILMYAWFTSALIYQGLVMRLGIVGGNLYLDFFISGAVELPAALLILITIDRIGRRLPFAIGNIVAGIACLITAFLPEDIPWFKTTVATLGRLGITIAFEIVYLVNSELYPTTLRNFGVSLCSSLCDLGGIIAPFLLFRLAAIWLELPLIIFSILAVVCGILVLLLPETKGISLPETVEDVEQLSGRCGKCGKKKKHQNTNSYI